MINADFLYFYTDSSSSTGTTFDTNLEIVGTTRDTDCEGFIGWAIGNGDYEINLTTLGNARSNEYDGNQYWTIQDEDIIVTTNIGSGLPPDIYTHTIYPTFDQNTVYTEPWFECALGDVPEVSISNLS